MLTIYNSLTRQKESFVPRVPGKIGMYVCGMTIYDLCHLGHGRLIVCYDVITRFLREEGYDLTYVRNITDIDDKIIARAAEQGVSIQSLTDHHITVMHEHAKALGTLPPDYEPRATAHIDDIIQLIQRLLHTAHAYITDQGDVCYKVSAFPEYGKLSNQDLDALISGSRIDINTDKQSPLDFVLWKQSKPGEPSWPSPWGEGRPGWHIECSAMAMKQLGEQFDIHGGGLDLQFPHHENEIAQSEAVTGHDYARYWVHLGMLQVNDEKMSKSTGNFYTIDDVLKLYHPEVLRYFLLSSHYRSALNYSSETIVNCSKALMRLYQSLRILDNNDHFELDSSWIECFREAMSDDFNTPVALSVLFQLSHEVNKTQSKHLAATLRHLGNILGLLQSAPELFLQQIVATDDLDIESIQSLITERNEARLSHNWALSDSIRQQLLSKGIELEDTKSGTTWRKGIA